MSKRAILIGCNYPGTKAALRGCVNDVWSVNKMITTHFGFDPADIKILIDTNEDYESPTGANIKKHLAELVSACEPGDVLFIHFSGHGTQVHDKDGDDEDNKDEAIVPTDLNIITDDDLRGILDQLPPNVKLTFVSDCCHSGSMLDHPVQQISGDKANVEVSDEEVQGAMFKGVNAEEESSNRAMPQTDFMSILSEKTGLDVAPGSIHRALQAKFGDNASAKTLKALGLLSGLAEKASQQGGLLGQAGGIFGSILAKAAEGAPPTPEAVPAPGQGGEGDGALITGCQAHETSADACPSGDPSKAFGALTNALTSTVNRRKQADPEAPISYEELVTEVRALLLKARFTQNPCLECADETVGKAFIC